MKSGLEIIKENEAMRKSQETAKPKIELPRIQTLQEKIENAAMVANRFGTPMDEAQRCMGMTDEQIENFKRS